MIYGESCSSPFRRTGTLKITTGTVSNDNDAEDSVLLPWGGTGNTQATVEDNMTLIPADSDVSVFCYIV